LAYRVARRFPQLNQLRVFEAAARHLSFTRAGEELSISQAAVSQQVKALETYFDTALFRRRHRTLELTDIGQAYLPAVAEALARLDAATEQIFPRAGRVVLTLRLSASLATLWLIPRLAPFYDAHPEIDLRLITHVARGESASAVGGADLEIRYGSGEWPGVIVDKLMDATIFPVCAPVLLDGEDAIKRPEDLTRHTLLHVIGYDADWNDWLHKAGARDVDPVRGQQFDATMMALQAAEGGGGVALGRRPMVDDQLEAGKLVKPFDGPELTRGAFYLVRSASKRVPGKAHAFRDWLLKQRSISWRRSQAACA